MNWRRFKHPTVFLFGWKVQLFGGAWWYLKRCNHSEWGFGVWYDVGPFRAWRETSCRNWWHTYKFRTTMRLYYVLVVCVWIVNIYIVVDALI